MSNNSNKILFEQNYEKVFKGVLIFCRNYHLAEDMTQEAFLKAFRVIHQLKKPEHFSAWVYTIAINLIKKEYVKKKKLNEMIQTQKGILFALRKDHISKKRKYRHLERWMLKID